MSQSAPSPSVNILLGIICSNILGGLLLAGSTALMRMNEYAGANIPIAISILIPLAIGITASYWWTKAGVRTFGMTLLWSFVDSLLALVVAALIVGEGWGCLVVISPLLILCVTLGAWFGGMLMRRKSPSLNLSVPALFATLFLLDALSPHDHHAAVVDTIVINAPPARVWPHVVAFPEIKAEPEYWFFRLGLPMPSRTTVDGYRQGAGRKCIFNNGVIFDEVMSVFTPERELTFDIVRQPADPEILGHITLDRGQFLLTDNGDGTTTLTGTSWYRLHVFPPWYFDLWATSITRNIHLRVMEHIKELAESRS